MKRFTQFLSKTGNLLSSPKRQNTSGSESDDIKSQIDIEDLSSVGSELENQETLEELSSPSLRQRLVNENISDPTLEAAGESLVINSSLNQISRDSSVSGRGDGDFDCREPLDSTIIVSTQKRATTSTSCPQTSSKSTRSTRDYSVRGFLFIYSPLSRIRSFWVCVTSGFIRVVRDIYNRLLQFSASRIRVANNCYLLSIYGLGFKLQSTREPQLRYRQQQQTQSNFRRTPRGRRYRADIFTISN
ncbi:hypothetical protein V1511DRAFT_349545 [Dipodascopsis uninucleata]